MRIFPANFSDDNILNETEHDKLQCEVCSLVLCSDEELELHISCHIKGV